jgi:hypothetical protein
MFIPDINTLCFARLYEDHRPIKVKINTVIDEHNYSITILNSSNEERIIDIRENGFLFFPNDINSKYCYVIIDHFINSYDNLELFEIEYLMCIDQAMLKLEILSKNSLNEYQVHVKKL